MNEAESAGRPKSAPAFVGWLALCFAVAGVFGAFTAKSVPAWYAALAKPGFNPPNSIFGPVWSE